MTKARKIFVGGASGAGILLVLLAAAEVLIPCFVDMDVIRRNIAIELEARHHIRPQRVKISYFPVPRMVMYGVKAISETINASVDELVIQPKILTLFTGTYEPAEIDLLGLTITERLPEQTRDSAAKPLSQQLLYLNERLCQLCAALATATPGVTIDARKGGLEVYFGQDLAFLVEDIDIRSSVHGQKRDFKLTSGKSNLWQAITLSGRVDQGTMNASGELSLTGANLREFMRCLNTPASDRVGDSQIDLSLAFSTSSPSTTRATFAVSVPQFTFAFDDAPPNPSLPPLASVVDRPNFAQSPQSIPGLKPAGIGSGRDSDRQGIALSNGTLSGALSIDTNGIDFSISHFRFDKPHLNLTASYVERYSEHRMTLNIDGRKTDVATVRNTLLALDKGNPTTRRTFEIIREGQVPEILFRSRGKNPSDLTKFENFTLKGSVEKGTVFAPEVDLLVSNVSGDVLVEDGVLIATRLSGKAAGSSTHDGELKIGLRREDHLFHMDLPIAADLADLPDVLSRVVESRDFKQQFAQIKDVTGKTQGRLILGENLKTLVVKVESGPFQLRCRYGSLPELIDLKGASFTMDGSKLSATSLTGKRGDSSLDQADLSWDWGEAGADYFLEWIKPLF